MPFQVEKKAPVVWRGQNNIKKLENKSKISWLELFFLKKLKIKKNKI